MRIANVCLDYPPRRTRYGSGTVSDDLIAELGRRGHEIRIVTPGRFERAGLPEFDERLIEVPAVLSTRHLLPPDRPTEMFASVGDALLWNDAACAWLIHAAPFDAWTPEIIHNDGWTTQPLSKALAQMYGCPIVSTAHVVDRHYAAVRDLPQRPAEALFQQAEEACFSGSDWIIVPSQTARDLAAFYYPAYESKLQVVAHGLDWSSTDTVNPSVVTDRSQGADVIVHYVGRISSERGWEPFIAAFACAAENDGRLRLRVIGDGRLSEAREKFPHPAIEFLGPLPRAQVLNELRQGDIFCNPALMETFGMAELEALGSGSCVISNTGFGKHTHVEHLKTGVRIPLSSSVRPQLVRKDWTTWLLALADDPTLRRQLGTAGRRIACQQFDVATMADNLLALFRRALVTSTTGSASTATLPS